VESVDLLARANASFAAGRYEDARDQLLQLLKERPGDSATLRSLGLVSTRLGQPAQAFRFCHQALQANPQDAEAHFSLAILYLLHGNYEKGFIEYEWRLARENCIAHRYAQGTVWDGRPLKDEALMLHCEQGFGDNLQFIRFLPQLRERVAKIYLACHPELVRLFSGLEGLAGIVTDKQALPPCDYHCPLLSLPRIFKTTLETLPREIPYLPASISSSSDSRRPRVGLVWRANRSSPNSNYRSIPLAALQSLSNLSLDWISLQRDPDDNEREILRTHFKAEDLGGTFHDFKDTADCLETLDLILTVDTSVVHLAGALGRPTWMLLPRWADWRWLLDRPDSPWYPTLTLFRQTLDGDWNHPLQAVREKLLATSKASFPFSG
jgi:Tetratricopeptide repeat